jgi:hypothetical protein
VTIEHIEIRRAHINLVSPFRTSFGVEVDRDLLYVHVVGDDEEGWGECVAMAAPLYSSEYVDGCNEVITRYLLPMITPTMTAEEFVVAASSIRGNFMAKAAVETALLDYQLRRNKMSLAINRSSVVIPSRPGALPLCIFFNEFNTSSSVIVVSRTCGVGSLAHVLPQHSRSFLVANEGL